MTRLRPTFILFVFFLLAGAPLAATAQSLSGSTTAVSLREGTTIRVRLLETLDTGMRLQAGSLVHFEVADPVLVNGALAIRPGARGMGTITHARKAKWLGRRGKLDFTIDYVQAVDGQNIRVRSTLMKERGRGNVGKMTVGVLALSSVAAPAALLIRGKNAVVEKGAEFTVFVDEDRPIDAPAASNLLTSY